MSLNWHSNILKLFSKSHEVFRFFVPENPEVADHDVPPPVHNIEEPKIEIQTSDPLACNVAAPSSTAAGRAPPDTGSLSGLCLVKREVHCYSVLDQLMKDETYSDVTITTDGHTFKAHKVSLF